MQHNAVNMCTIVLTKISFSAVLNSLRSLCTATDILTDPTRLPEEALAAVNRTERRRSMQ